MMTDGREDWIDDLLADAARTKAAPDDGLVARVLADAHRVQAEGWPQADPAPGFWAQLTEVLGGWPSFGGLAAASAAGLWLGLAPPAAADAVVAGLFGETVSVALLPDAEGGLFDE